MSGAVAATAPVVDGGWTTDPARTAEITGPKVVERGLGAAPVPLVLPAMASADLLDYALDPSAWLAQAGDALARVAVSVPAPVQSTDLQVLWCTLLAGQAVLLVAGGTPGSVVPIEITLDTDAGRRLVQLARLPINTDSPAAAPPVLPRMLVGAVLQGVPPNALRLPGGGVLVTDAGLPFLLA